jgi:phosphate transport system substrate-binding protein
MIQKLKAAVIVITSVYCFYSCGSEGDNASAYDSPKQGTINISVDESFEPVISEQIKVYESSYPGTKINATYKSEAGCFRDLQKDSTRMIIVAKGLTEEERKLFKDKLSYPPKYDILAYDAVSVIINKDANDSVFTIKQLQNMLNGKDTTKAIVLDGKNATSTVRYLLDSILHGQNFSSRVMAGTSSKAVIDYVSKNVNAVGFVGSSWVTNDQDPEQVAYRDKIKFALLECKNNCDSGSFAKPSQATITYLQYPLVRPLYYILKENANGLGTGFTNYLNLERGQLVFKRSFLVPGKMNFDIRKSDISQ